MKIRAGYEISYDCPQATPMILTLSVHPSRVPDLLSWDRMRIDPPVQANTYHDSFGNFCHVIRAPTGRLTVSTDFVRGAVGRTCNQRGHRETLPRCVCHRTDKSRIELEPRVRQRQNKSAASFQSCAFSLLLKATTRHRGSRPYSGLMSRN
jgi:hypothetical protein